MVHPICLGEVERKHLKRKHGPDFVLLGDVSSGRVTGMPEVPIWLAGPNESEPSLLLVVYETLP